MNPNESGWTTVTKKSKKVNMSTDKKTMSPTSNKATQHSIIIKETMNIEQGKVGLVAGRKACNLKRLKEIYGVRFILPPKGGSQIILEGPAKMVEAAKKDIEQNLSCKTSLFIEKDHINLLIGSDEISTLEDALNLRIDIQEDGEVSITGTRCEEAKKAIEENLSCCVSSFFIEKKYRHLLIGRGGATIFSLEKAHNVKISTGDCGKVLILAKNKTEYVAAKKAIEHFIKSFKAANPYQKMLSVPAHLIGHVIGKNSSNAKRIESTYGVHVLLPSRTRPRTRPALLLSKVHRTIWFPRQRITSKRAFLARTEMSQSQEKIAIQLKPLRRPSNP